MNALNNTLLAQAQNAIVANAADAATYQYDEIAEQKAAEKTRDADLKQGAKNAQSDTGAKKSRTTRTKLKNSVNVSEVLNTKVSTTDDRTIEQLCESIRETHAQLQANQIDQITGFAKQGRDMVQIKKALLTQKQLKESDEKQINRVFGQRLKEAGIGDDVIARQARGMYIWLSENESEARAFVQSAIDTPKDERTKDQKKIANAHARIGLTPYVIMSAMTSEEKEAAQDTIDKIVKNAIDRADKLGIDKAALIRAIQSA